MKIGKLIKRRRLELGLSQEKLAKMLALNSPQLISNIERNRCGFPRKRLKRLSRALLIDKMDLFRACAALDLELIAKDLGIQFT